MATRERSGAYADYAYESPPSPRVKTYDENSRRPETESRPFYAGGEYRTFEEQERWEERQRYENALQIPEPAIDRHRSRSAQYERRQAPESEFIIRQESRKARHYSDEPKDKYQNKPGSSSLEFSFESFPDSEFVIRQKPRTPQQGYPDEASARLRNSTPAASPSVDDRFEELNIEEDAVTSSDSSSVEDREDIQSKCSKCIELLRSASRNLRQSSDQHVRPAVDDIARFARRLDDQAFYLEIWVREAGLSALPDDANDWESVAFARTVLTRLHKRAKKLADSGKKCAQPSEWSFNGPSNKSIENDLSDDENGSLPSINMSLPASIEQDIKGIELQIRTLRRLTRSVRQTQQHESERALRSHVEEIKKYFGTEDLCKIYSSGDVVPGHVALERAQEIAPGLAAR